MTKICTCCKEEKPLSDFYKRKNRPIGVTPRCKKCTNKISMQYKWNHPEKRSFYSKKRYEKKQKEIIQKAAEWNKENKERRNLVIKKYYDKNIKNNPTAKLNQNISTSIWRSLKEGKNHIHWEKFVDFKFSELISHLESKFQDGMDWANYGKWHVDHIRPISSFTFSSAKDREFKQCWNLDNLQPLWARDNLSKGIKRWEC